ncbi:MAG: xanthine dehydrogenase accessory protein XdhC [Neomegalonema sp.]|nr:xanthine dehydrogenase accessory protein XdhC [Neomegalonema sp.]
MRADALKQAVICDGAAVLILVVGAEGSTPREAGAAMVVSCSCIFGTVGGGAAEADAVAIAQEMLATAERRREKRYALGPELDQCCGGAFSLAFRRYEVGEELTPPLLLWPGGATYAPPWRAPLLVYGAGHVGQAVVRALSPLDYAITWVDSRLGAFDHGSAAEIARGVDTLATPFPEAAAEEAPAQAYHLVLTHSHAEDLEIVDSVLAGEFAFLGLIGSKTKRALFERRLRERGHPQEAIDRLCCPIGAAPTKDKRPASIAVSVALQMMLLREAAGRRLSEG